MKQALEQVIDDLVKELFDTASPVELTRPDEQFGDYATNVALQLSKRLGRNPREIAQAIADKLKQRELVADASVAGPGFLNLRLTDNALAGAAQYQRKGGKRQNATVVIETNNPNPFKAMHIGHAFNAILADTVANLLETDGARTYRVSYHGDVGLHVGKSMYSLLNYIEGDIAKLDRIPESERNGFMSRMYAEGSAAYKSDAHAKQRIDELTKESFTRTDSTYAAVYDLCKQWSFDQIDTIVARLGNKPTVYRFLESDADARGVPIVQKHVPDVFYESDGALVFPGSKYGSFDNVYVTSRGLGLYGARDLGLMQLKHEQFHPKHSYIVTAEEQRDYFKGVIAAAELCLPELKGVTVNISTGTVKLTTGKMSSRSGDVVEISWLFDKVSEAVAGRGGKPTGDVIAGALRYQFLKNRIGSDVIFDVDESVSLQGNSGPYLQYAHARARSILLKAKMQPATLENQTYEVAERSLLRKISEYGEIIDRSTAELMPHHICTYLYELAQKFNKFYEHNRVIGEEREHIRLALVAQYANTLKNGLGLLGITAPERM